MSNALTTDFWAAVKKVGLASLLLIQLALPGYAKVYRPLQILLPGNLNGNIAELNSNLKIKPGLCWRMVSQTESFRRLTDRDTLVIAPGNDANLYSPISYLFLGSLERNLIAACIPDALGISPNDLEMAAGNGLDSAIKQRVWSNQVTFDGEPVFKPYSVNSTVDSKIWYMNFISQRQVAHLPLENWGNIEIESPRRSLRRLAPDFSTNDISISTVYLTRNEIDQLSAELRRLPGWHLVIQVVSPSLPALFSTNIAERSDNVWFISIEAGEKQLPQINLIRRNQGYPRLTVRHLAYAKIDGKPGEKLFNQEKDRIKQELVKPLRVIKPSFQASTSAFSLSGKAHASLIKSACRSDIAFLRIPHQQHLVDNVICTGHILSNMGNDRIHTFRLAGNELFSLAGALIKNSDTHPTAFAGCEATWFAGRLSSLKVAGQPCRPDKNYIISTTERTLQDATLKTLDFYHKMRGYEGMTLWRTWLDTLKSTRISDERLVE